MTLKLDLSIHMWYSLTNDWKLIQSEHKGENMKKQRFNAKRRLKLKEIAISNLDNKLKERDIFSDFKTVRTKFMNYHIPEARKVVAKYVEAMYPPKKAHEFAEFLNKGGTNQADEAMHYDNCFNMVNQVGVKKPVNMMERDTWNNLEEKDSPMEFHYADSFSDRHGVAFRRGDSSSQNTVDLSLWNILKFDELEKLELDPFVSLEYNPYIGNTNPHSNEKANALDKNERDWEEKRSGRTVKEQYSNQRVLPESPSNLIKYSDLKGEHNGWNCLIPCFGYGCHSRRYGITEQKDWNILMAYKDARQTLIQKFEMYFETRADGKTRISRQIPKLETREDMEMRNFVPDFVSKEQADLLWSDMNTCKDLTVTDAQDYNVLANLFGVERNEKTKISPPTINIGIVNTKPVINNN